MTKPLVLVYGHRCVFEVEHDAPRCTVCPLCESVPSGTPSAFVLAAQNVRVLCVKAINIEIRAREFPKFTAAEDSAVSFPRRNCVSVDLLYRGTFRDAAIDERSLLQSICCIFESSI